MLGKGDNDNRWMLDLKKPREINRPKHVEQIQSYLSQEKVALGVLFSGDSAVAYVNPEHSCVVHIWQTITEQELEIMPELDLKKYPIKIAHLSSGSIQEMVNFFRPLRCTEKFPDIQSITTKLTEDYVKKLRRELKLTTRTEKVQQVLLETVNNHH